MRFLAPALFVALSLWPGAGLLSASAAEFAPDRSPAVTSTQETGGQQVDDNDDTRVEVQLVMLGIAAFVVVGVGTAGYVLRKKLGLVAGPPEQPTGGHH
jgi:hypothetical protein